MDFEPYIPPQPGQYASNGDDQSSFVRGQDGVVVIGGGTAGWSVAQRLKVLDPDCPVTLVTGCSGDIYAKPELSVALSRGLDEARLNRGKGCDVAARYGIRLMAGAFVTGLDPMARRVRTTSGTVRYRALVFAYGAQPIVLPELPADLVWRVNNLPAWLRLKATLGDTPRTIAVIGAGPVGCELAEDAARAGHSVTLLSRGPWPMDTLLPGKAGSLLASRIVQSGITLRNDTQVIGVRKNDEGSVSVRLQNNDDIIADLAISAVGLRTDLRLPAMAGLKTDCGIIVDENTLRTSDPAIFALGDCISVGGRPCRYIGPIGAQADAIAHAILGLEHAGYVHEIPPLRLKSRALPLELRGLPDPERSWEVVEDSPKRLAMRQCDGEHVIAFLEAMS
nr:FAD-dependent oxidoreductase [Acetobacter conturbans]